MKFNFTFEKSDFFCIFLLKIWIFFWNEIFLKCCVRVEFEFSSTSVFSTSCFVIRFSFRYELFDQVLSFFFFVIRRCYLKNHVIRIFFFSIGMKVWCYKSEAHFWWYCYVIFNRWRSNTNAISHQIRRMMLNEYHIYVMKNDSIRKFFVIQKTHKNFHFVRFFFSTDFFQSVIFDSSNRQIWSNSFNYFQKYQKKQLFKSFFAMFDFSVFQQIQQNVMATILRNFNWTRLLLLFSMQRRNAVFEILKKLKKTIEKKSTFLKIFVNFILNDTEAFVDYDLKKLFVERFFLIWKVYDAKTQKNYRHHMNMHKIKNVWNEKKRDMFLNYNDEILRYAIKMTRSERNFRKIMTAVKKIKNYRFAHSKKKSLSTNRLWQKTEKYCVNTLMKKKSLKIRESKKWKNYFTNFRFDQFRILHSNKQNRNQNKNLKFQKRRFERVVRERRKQLKRMKLIFFQTMTQMTAWLWIMIFSLNSIQNNSSRFLHVIFLFDQS